MNDNEKILFCGDTNNFGIELKILNINMKNYADCTYKIYVKNNEYGIFDENVLNSHNFIECNVLRNDIAHAISLFENKEKIINLTNIVKNESVEYTLKQILRLFYCIELKEQYNILYSNSINNSILDNINFIMTGHDSMRNYFLIPFLISNDIYIGIIEQNSEIYENFNCNDIYDWNTLNTKYYKIEQNIILNVFKCVKKYLKLYNQ